MKNGVRVHCWTEPVDRMVVAVHARVRITRFRFRDVRGLSVMVLLANDEALGWDREFRCRTGHVIATNRLREVLRTEHGGHLPFICKLDNVGLGDVA